MSSPNHNHDFFRQNNTSNDDLMFLTDDATEEASTRTPAPAVSHHKPSFLKGATPKIPFFVAGSNAASNSTTKQQKSPAAGGDTQEQEDDTTGSSLARQNRASSLDLDLLNDIPDSNRSSTPETIRTALSDSEAVESTQKDDALSLEDSPHVSYSQRVVLRADASTAQKSPSQLPAQPSSIFGTAQHNKSIVASARTETAQVTAQNQASPQFTMPGSSAKPQARASITPPTQRQHTSRFTFSLTNRPSTIPQQRRRSTMQQRALPAQNQTIPPRAQPETTPVRARMNSLRPLVPPRSQAPQQDSIATIPPARVSVEEEELYKKEQQNLELLTSKEKGALDMMEQIDEEMVSSKQMHQDTNTKLVNLSHKLALNLDPTNEVLIKLQAGNILRQHMLLEMLYLQEEMDKLQTSLTEVDAGQSIEDIQLALGKYKE